MYGGFAQVGFRGDLLAMIGRLRNVIFILVLGSVCTTLLLWIKGYTLPMIERYQEFRLKSSILEAAGVAYDSNNLDKVFHENIREMKNDGFIYYLSPDDSYIFEFEGRGLWGIIQGVITLDPDLETIENIRIISQEETPGLGGRISEEDFLVQFRGKKVSPRLSLILRRRATEVNEVDSISGASLTSQALIDMINESVLNFRQLLGR